MPCLRLIVDARLEEHDCQRVSHSQVSGGHLTETDFATNQVIEVSPDHYSFCSFQPSNFSPSSRSGTRILIVFQFIHFCPQIDRRIL